MRAADYRRFSGFLVEIKTFAAVNGLKRWTGRMSFAEDTVTLDLSAIKAKGKKKVGVPAAPQTVSFPLQEIERANLIAEI